MTNAKCQMQTATALTAEGAENAENGLNPGNPPSPSRRRDKTAMATARLWRAGGKRQSGGRPPHSINGQPQRRELFDLNGLASLWWSWDVNSPRCHEGGRGCRRNLCQFLANLARLAP